MPKKTQLVPKRRILVPKRKDFLRYEKILNTRGDQAFYMGAENAKMESAEKSAETGGHHSYRSGDILNLIFRVQGKSDFLSSFSWSDECGFQGKKIVEKNN